MAPATPAAPDMKAAAQRSLWPTSWRKIGGRRCASSLFHVKQGTASRPLSISSPAGGSKTNLIAESTFPSVWTRHIADSAQLLALAPGASRWVDMGSGAGFPGLVIAIQLADVPGAVVHCIESDQRKCAFLREAVRAHRGRGGDPRLSGSRRSTPPASELWTPSPRAPSPPCR